MLLVLERAYLLRDGAGLGAREHLVLLVAVDRPYFLLFVATWRYFVFVLAPIVAT